MILLINMWTIMMVILMIIMHQMMIGFENEALFCIKVEIDYFLFYINYCYANQVSHAKRHQLLKRASSCHLLLLCLQSSIREMEERGKSRCVISSAHFNSFLSSFTFLQFPDHSFCLFYHHLPHFTFFHFVFHIIMKLHDPLT